MRHGIERRSSTCASTSVGMRAVRRAYVHVGTLRSVEGRASQEINSRFRHQAAAEGALVGASARERKRQADTSKDFESVHAALQDGPVARAGPRSRRAHRAFMVGRTTPDEAAAARRIAGGASRQRSQAARRQQAALDDIDDAAGALAVATGSLRRSRSSDSAGTRHPPGRVDGEVTNLPLPVYRNYQSLINLVPGATPAQTRTL